MNRLRLPEAASDTVSRHAAKPVGLLADAPSPAGLPRVTASVGGIVFIEPPASTQAAFAAADRAMSAARRGGKNRAPVAAAGSVR